MATLYEINEEIYNCFDSETGEVLDEEKLNALYAEKKQKFENVALAIKNLTSDIADLKNEEKAFAERRKQKERQIEGYKRWLALALDGKQFETVKCAVSFRKSTQTIPFEDFVSWAQLHERDDLLIYATPAANKTAIKEALLRGESLPAKLQNNVKVIVK